MRRPSLVHFLRSRSIPKKWNVWGLWCVLTETHSGVIFFSRRPLLLHKGQNLRCCVIFLECHRVRPLRPPWMFTTSIFAWIKNASYYSPFSVFLLFHIISMSFNNPFRYFCVPRKRPKNGFFVPCVTWVVIVRWAFCFLHILERKPKGIIKAQGEYI